MKRNRYVMYAISLLQGMVFYGPIATLYRQAQGVSIFEITLIESISLALLILLEVPWGMLADKIGYKKTMVVCCGLYFLSKLVFWQATDFAGFLLERILLSVVLAGFSGVDTSVLYLSCQPKDSQRVFGIYNSLGMVGLLAAAGIFSLFVKDNYRLAGLLTAVSYGIAALLSAFLVEVKPAPQPKAPPEPFRATLLSTFRDRKLLLFLVAVALLSEAHQTITVFLSQLQYDRCGMGSASIGLVYMLTTGLGALGVCSAAVTRRLKTAGSLVLLCVLAAAACLALGLTGNAAVSVLGILGLRLSHTLFQPFWQALQNQQITAQNRATALSVHSMVINCIAIGTNLLFGALADWHLHAAFFFGSGICLLGLLLLLAWHRQNNK